MGEVADRLAALTVSMTSPDGDITAGLRAVRPTELTFRPDAYERYTEPALAHQLARTLELLYAARNREAGRIMDAAGMTRATRPEDARDEFHYRYLVALQGLAPIGIGPQGCVTFEVAGWTRWRCRISGGTLQVLTEPDFVAEVLAAAGNLLQHARFEKALLRNRFFGTKRAPPVEQWLPGAG